jgi:hypothetical protein
MTANEAFSRDGVAAFNSGDRDAFLTTADDPAAS